jgi:hypothetical protein
MEKALSQFTYKMEKESFKLLTQLKKIPHISACGAFLYYPSS